MPYIGNVELSAIENIESEDTGQYTEIDVLNSDANLLARGAGSVTKLTVDFALFEGYGSEATSLEDKRDAVKGLLSQPANKNAIDYGEYYGHLAVAQVEIPRENPTLMRGRLTALYLPWPEYYPERKPATGQDVFGFGRTFGRSFGGDS